MPSGRRFPLAFGTYTRRTGTGCQEETVWWTQTAISALAFEDRATCPSIPAVRRPALRCVTCRTLTSVFDQDRSSHLLQGPGLGPVLLPRRLEDPLPQPPYVALVDLPVDGIPVRHALRSVHVPGRCHLSRRGAFHLGHRGGDPGAAVPHGGGEAVARHRVQLALRFGWLDRHQRSRAHLPTSAPFPGQPPGWYPASYPRAPGGGAGNAALGFLPPFGRRRSLLGHPVPPAGFRSPHGRPTRQRLDPGGVSTFRTSETRPDWVPSLPRGPAVLTRPVRSLRPPLAPSSRGQALSPRRASISRSCLLRGVIKGSLAFTRPAFPLACWSLDGTRTPWARSRASHPGRQDLPAHAG